ncbi:MAG: COG4705 family protein [Vulcanimicrobiaceae bacterium]
MSNKVPEVTAYFWVIKILATTVGETAADYLSTTLHLGLVSTSYIMSAIFIIGLVFQLSSKKYIPTLYWFVVVLISIVGTLISDNIVENLGVALTTSTTIFGITLIVVFILWWFSERTLSVHSIVTRKRELFYWAAILFTFALGTSAGDLISEASGLGYPLAALLFASLIGVVAFAYYRLKIIGVLAFWLAYILTRPLGASIGDLLSQSTKAGGLGLGTTITSAVFLAVIIGLVTFLTITHTDRIPALEPQDVPA